MWAWRGDITVVMKSKQSVSCASTCAACVAIVLLTLISTGTANATTVTITGSFTITESGFTGNLPGIQTPSTSKLSNISSGPNFTGNFSNTLTVGTVYTWNFFTAAPTATCGAGCATDTEGTHHYPTDVGTLNVAFNFTAPGVAGPITDYAIYQAKYGGLPLSCTSSPSGNTDCINWHVHNLEVDFSVGNLTDVLLITLTDFQDWNMTPTISLEVLQRTGGNQNGTPLPAALPLFASGTGVLGFLGWRRRRNAAALAA